MTTTFQSLTSRRGRAVAATLLASAASVVGMMSAAPAQAADQYIALALGYVSENPPVTMAGGSSIAGTQNAAGAGRADELCEQRRRSLRDRSHRHERVRGRRVERLRRRGRSLGPHARRSGGRCQEQAAEPDGREGHRVGLLEWVRPTTPPPPPHPPPRRPRPSRGRRCRSTRSLAALSLTSPTAAV